MTDDYTGPCRTCGSTDVRTAEERGERSATDVVAPTIRTRVCDNPECPTNTGDKSLTDVV